MKRTDKRDTAALTPRSPVWIRFAALLCCLMWVIGASGMLPAVVAFLGGFDSTHEVLVMGNRASTTVVFHHQTKEAEALERHSLLMQVFTVVAATSGESNDHVMGFSNGGDCKAGELRAALGASAPECEEASLSLSDTLSDKHWEGVPKFEYLRMPPPRSAAVSRGMQLRI